MQKQTMPANANKVSEIVQDAQLELIDTVTN